MLRVSAAWIACTFAFVRVLVSSVADGTMAWAAVPLKQFVMSSTECSEGYAVICSLGSPVACSSCRMADACVLLLGNAEITSTRMLASVNVEQLRLPVDTSGGKLAVLQEACERAAALKASAADTSVRPRTGSGSSTDREPGELPESGAFLPSFALFLLSVWLVTGTDRLAAVLERFVTTQQAPVVAQFPLGTEQMCDVLKEALGKPRDWDECNLGERLAKHKGTLLDFLPLCSWPPMLAVRLFQHHVDPICWMFLALSAGS